MAFAVVVDVDNSGEDPDAGRRGLRDELAPAVRQLPGFESGLFLTAYERGDGLGVVVLATRENAEGLAAGFPAGAEIRPGVIVKHTAIFEVTATA